MNNDYEQFNSLEWLNENLSRNYPIVGTAASSLPTSFLADIQLVIPYMENVDTSKFFVSRVSRTGDSLQVTIGYLISEPGAIVTGFDCAVSTAIPISARWPFLNPQGTEYMAIDLLPITVQNNMGSSSYGYGIPDSFSAMRNMHGALYIGTCVDMQEVSNTAYTYEQTAIIPIRVYKETKPTELRKVTVIDENGQANTFTQELILKLDEGLTATTDLDNNIVTIGIDEEWVEERMDAKVQELEGYAIKTINGVKPDRGNIQIIGLDCTQIDKVSNGVITISNPCSKPCCDQNGTDSISISNAMTELVSAKDTLNNYYTELATKVNSIQSRLASLIASRR